VMWYIGYEVSDNTHRSSCVYDMWELKNTQYSLKI
jgi:hypothetical protein